MELLKLILRNTLRHPLRSFLTALGVAVALFAFCMIRTIIGAWYAGVEATAKNRLVVRNAVSLVFPLPVSYAAAIGRTPGVAKLGHGNWFGGVYKDESYRMAQFAIDDNYLDIYPEFKIDPAQKEAWLADRKGALIGRELADRFGLKVGDVVQIKGTIFPGLWEFTVRAVFDAPEKPQDTRLLYFHWKYLNESNKDARNGLADNVGFYVVQLQPGASPAAVSAAIDEQFANSYAETLTETETAFIQGFVSMSSAIIAALNIIAGVVIAIMLLVLANTMLMSFRERRAEYAILKALGFELPRLAFLILGESALLCLLGYAFMMLLLLPVFLLPPQTLLGAAADLIPALIVQRWTLATAAVFAVVVAAAAGAFPVRSLQRLSVADGIRELA